MTVIVGAGYKHGESLTRRLAASGYRHRMRQNVTDMLAAYLDCDVAVGSGGLTASELVASRTPAILISTYEHQIARCRHFHNNGWARYLGYRRVDSTTLANAVTTPRLPDTAPVFNTRAIVDTCNEIVG